MRTNSVLLGCLTFLGVTFAIVGCDEQKQLSKESGYENNVKIEVSPQNYGQTMRVKLEITVDAHSKRDALRMAAKAVAANADMYQDDPPPSDCHNPMLEKVSIQPSPEKADK